ncbi:MAG: sugar phosphate isomerase/epimerase family protein [bacterium]|nr:sugar phosphate isomerase/epimerase family protein [bacterium]
MSMQEASRIRFGISSFATVRQPLAEVESALAGFGVGVEVMCEVPHAWPAPVPWQRGNLLALHVPMLGINIASTNPGIRKESASQVIDVIGEAARLGAPGVVVHPGAPPHEGVLPRDRGLPYAIESLRLCAEAAGAAGLEVYLENMPAIAQFEGGPRIAHSYGAAYDELRHIFEAVGHPSLRLCLDLGHAFLSGRGTLEALVADEDVVHVHASDNRGGRDDHLAWGDGEVSKSVDLAHDLPRSVRTVVFETNSLEACARSLVRVGAWLCRP